ncbi:MAG: alpha/beta hydrolase [Sulfitobacter sp.]|nr:alpha/beta hydrolase [Sulfitobacter sp.]
MTLGKGKRRALALHCTMAFGGAWKGLSNALPELTMLAPDMPSHGRSPDWDEVSDFSDTVYAGTLSVMDEGPMDVIGHSFGAVTALRLAVAHPERVRSLTVIEPVFFAVALQDAPETLAQHDSDAQPFRDAIEAGDRETAARTFNRMWSAEAPKWDDMPERNRAAMVRAIHVVPDTHAFLYDDTAGLLDPGALDACTIPTVVLRGEHAHPAISANNDGLAARMPNAVQSVIEGAGHMAPISHPEAVADVLRELLSRS